MARPTAAVSVREAFNHVYVIDLAGELTSSTDTALLNAYQQLSNDGARVLILNFSRLEYKNTSGINLLVMLLTRAQAAGQHLFAAQMSEDYRNILQVTQLDQGITIYITEADALQAAHELLETPDAPPVPTREATTAEDPVRKASTESWAKPVDYLSIGKKPGGGLNLNVQGRRLFGPLQGFGQLWQKTYRIALRKRGLTPQQVIATWKENVPRLKPPQKRFYPSLAGIAPNELVLIDAHMAGVPISTGVMVLYAGAESFTLMTPAGHPEAGWVTFSSYLADGCTFAQVQVLARASDPLYELAFRFAGSKLQDQIWTHVLTELATLLGTSGELQMHNTLLDPKLQWQRAGNIWYNAQLRTLLHGAFALVRRIGALFRPKRRRLTGEE
ncbi:MAG: STAS domain-containing protein [Verrucomicrobia bacterium]|nr:STAS domain-containing protein [Verrucomicrobiota bacterium]